ncbi:c-type cytochrome [Marinobacterium sp. YM272]|uniref:c-type cytochrome n=1 Tax=Marinobacterium sp. YM272 TaxID=3421654 RepID=UPI003D7F42E0
MMKTLSAGGIGLSMLLISQLGVAQTGAEVVEKHCIACHEAGVGGAPKPDDKAAWAPRLATGMDAMLATVKAGKGAMPKMGTCMSCSDEELSNAISELTAGAR